MVKPYEFELFVFLCFFFRSLFLYISSKLLYFMYNAALPHYNSYAQSKEKVDRTGHKQCSFVRFILVIFRLLLCDCNFGCCCCCCCCFLRRCCHRSIAFNFYHESYIRLFVFIILFYPSLNIISINNDQCIF